MAEAAPVAKGYAYVSKRRFKELEAVVADAAGAERAAQYIRRMREVLQFDPDAPTGSEEKTAKIREWRARRRAETGESLYVITGAKKAYEARKNRLKGQGGASDPQQQ